MGVVTRNVVLWVLRSPTEGQQHCKLSINLREDMYTFPNIIYVFTPKQIHLTRFCVQKSILRNMKVKTEASNVSCFQKLRGIELGNPDNGI
jgi:hypothetical protein